MRAIGIYLSIIALFAISAGRANAQYIDTVCPGETGAEYYTSPRAGSSFYWEVQDGTIASSTADGSKIWVDWGMAGGVKKITVVETTGNGCTGKPVEAYVLVFPVGELKVFGPDAVCRGEQVELQASGADAYLWSTGATTSSVQVKPADDTTYSVIGYFGECGTQTSLHDLQVKYRPQADFSFSPDDPIAHSAIQFKYTGTNNVDDWRWTFDEPNQQPEHSNFMDPQYTMHQAGVLKVHLNVSNDFGCMDSITKYIIVEAGINVFIPTAFTPNQDGFNNIFIPTYEHVKKVEFVVYDRWGEEMFTTQSLTEGWDGTYKGAAVPDGVFVYFVKVIGQDNKSYSFKGTVTVLH